MVTHICYRCHRIFNKKSSYDTHINRKNKCSIKVIDNDDTNIMKNIGTLNEILEEFKKIKEDNIKCKKEIEEVKEKNKELTNKIINLEQCNSTATQLKKIEINNNITQNNITQNNITQNINVTPFGKEKMDFVVEDLSKICQGNKTIPNFVNHVHFNKNMPENHNVFLPSKKNRKEVFVFDGDEWMLRDKNDIIEHLIERGIGYVEGRMNELENHITKSKLNAVKRMITTYTNTDDPENKNLTKKMSNEIELILYNKKHMIKTKS